MCRRCVVSWTMYCSYTHTLRHTSDSLFWTWAGGGRIKNQAILLLAELAEFTWRSLPLNNIESLLLSWFVTLKPTSILNLFTPLLHLFLSSYCQFYPCLTFVLDKQMLLNLGLLSRPLENSSQSLTKECWEIF